MAFGDGAREYIDHKIAGMVTLMQNLAGHAEAEMKQNAPWRDRTGNARNGLHAGVEVGRDQFTFYLSHGVEYGVFLELAHGGNYAIVRPTADQYKTRLRDEVLDWWRSV